MNEKKKGFMEQTLNDAGYRGKITGFSECVGCGECCLTNACSCVPDEFSEITVKSIEELIDSGKYMITASYDVAVGRRGIPVKAYPHISAREANCPEDGVNITMMHSKCTMLGDNGCKFNEDERPVQGLLLIPMGIGCKCFVDTPTAIWKPYEKVLDEIVVKRKGKTTQQLFEEELFPLAKELKQKIQMSVIYNQTISLQEKIAAEALLRLGAFHGLFGNELGEVIEDFMNLAHIKPIK